MNISKNCKGFLPLPIKEGWYIMEQKLIEVLGAEVLLDEVLRALFKEQRDDILSFIARMYDVEVEE